MKITAQEISTEYQNFLADKVNVLDNGDSMVGFGYEPLGGVVRIDDNDPRITYSKGDWTTKFEAYGGREGLNPRYTYSNTVGASLSFNFIGTAIYLNTFLGGPYGKIGITVDGGAEILIDLYSATFQLSYIPLATGLTFGNHNISITTKTKNALSTNNIVNIFYFDVITTTNSSIKLAKDGIQNKSSALTLGNLCESDVDITQNIDEITQLAPNASFKRKSQYRIVFQDDFNRADGAVGNGWNNGSIVSNKLSLPANYISINGSPSWSDIQMKFSFVAPSVALTAFVNFTDVNNNIYVQLNGSFVIGKCLNGSYSAVSSTSSITVTKGTTYYVTIKKSGQIYSASITTNSDYTTGATTIYGYDSTFTTGKIGLGTAANDGATLIDSVEVTAPVPYGYTPLPVEGTCYSISENTVKATNNLSVASGVYQTINAASMIPVTAGQSYTFKIKRKLSSYTSGNGALSRILWYQSDGTTNISYIDSSFVTAIDSNFVEATLTAVAPENAAFASCYGRLDGIGICEWKEPLFELTSTATGVFHEKESRMDLVSLNTSGSVVVTKGTGEDEISYRVEQDGVISKFYRDSATIPHWDRAKIWTGGTGWSTDISSSYSGSSRLRSNTLDDVLYISFVGTGINIFGSQSSSHGIMGITVDGGTEFYINQYNPSSVNNALLTSIKGLSYGQHQIKLRCTHTTLVGISSDYYITVDAFDIYVPKIPATPANCQPLGAVLKTDPDDGWIRYEETEGVVYSGTWTSSSNSLRSGGTHIGNTGALNEYAEFAFLGTGIRYIGMKNTPYGIAEVFTDEGSGYASRGTVDEYNSTALVQQVLFSRTGIPLALNKIKINCTHTKNVSATDYVNTVDAFEVKQPLYTIDLRKQLPQGTKQYIDKLLGNIYNLKTSAKNVAEAINEVHDEGDVLNATVVSHKAETVHIGAVGFVTGSTSSPTTTSTSFVDMPDMSVTVTTKGGNLLLMFNAGVFNNTTGGVVATVFTLDGNSINGSAQYPVSSSANNEFSANMLWRVTGLAAGSHTIKVQWAVNTGQTATSYATHRNLLAMEVKSPC